MERKQNKFSQILVKLKVRVHIYSIFISTIVDIILCMIQRGMRM